MRLPWLKIVGALLLIWLLAGGAMALARRAKVTPASVGAYLAAEPLNGKDASARMEAIEKISHQLNQLGYEQRREVRMSKALDNFFRKLSAEEQIRFLDLTLPTGFKQMMEALNKMPPEKRKQFVTRALDDMKKREGENPPSEEADANARKIMEQGFKSFYSEASADVKMDVAPLIEQMQKNMSTR